MNEIAYFDPLLFKFPKGPVVKETEVLFCLKTDENTCFDHVYFMIKRDEDDGYEYIEMEKEKGFYKISFETKKSGHYWFNFQIVEKENYFYVNRSEKYFSYISKEKGEDFLQLVLEEEYDCKNSMQGGLIYQIFVDRFNKVGEVLAREPLVLRGDWGGNIKKNTTNPVEINKEVFGGNFKGITEKLDYLKKLGVNIIYLNPICQANSNHKYDTSDYMKIDDMFGGEKDFKELISKAKEKEIKIIIDGVYNHTGSDSMYFNKNKTFDTIGAYNSKESRFFKWYNFENFPDKYDCWWGINTLPKINENSRDFHEFIAGENGVLEKYLKLGVDGFRLDVVDEFGDDFVKQISNKIKDFGKQKVVLGEVWEDAATKISYSKRRKYFSNNELNSVMNYPFRSGILDYVLHGKTETLVSAIRMVECNYPKIVKDNLMNFLTTHDTNRVNSLIQNEVDDSSENKETRLKIAMVLLMTLPGVPSIFYGDEYGMLDNDGSSRSCFDWKNYKNENFKWVQKLTNIRKNEVFKSGEIEILYDKYGKLVFERVSEKERIIVMANIGKEPLNINIEGDFKSFFTGEERKKIKLRSLDYDILIEK